MTTIKDRTRSLPVIGRPELRRGLKARRRDAFERMGSDRFSRLAIDGLDELLWQHLGRRGGTFVEAGAHDGVTYSNTYWLERFQDWSGVLVEPVAAQAARAATARPASRVFHAALVDPGREGEEVELVALDLASTVAGAFGGDRARSDAHLEHGVRTQPVLPHTERAPGRTLSAILDEAGVTSIDLLSLDVEGSEVAALQGLDLTRHRPELVLVEVLDPEDLAPIAAALGDDYEDLGRVTPQDHLFVHR